MSNYIQTILSLLLLPIYIMFSYELVCYQKNINEALVETYNIVLLLQKDNDLQQIIDDNHYFKSIELSSIDMVNYIEYSLTTIKDYRCEINFYKFSCEDIITTVKYYSAI